MSTPYILILPAMLTKAEVSPSLFTPHQMLYLWVIPACVESESWNKFRGSKKVGEISNKDSATSRKLAKVVRTCNEKRITICG